MKMKYRAVEPISREAAAKVSLEDNPQTLVSTLVSVAFFEPDYRWAQDFCLKYCVHSDKDVRAVAVTCLGHIARIHRKLDLDRVRPILLPLKNDAHVAGPVDDAEDDFEVFLGRRL